MPNTAENLEISGNEAQVEKVASPENQARIGADVMGDIKVYLHQEGHLIDTIPLTTEPVDDADIIAEFGLTENLKDLFEGGDMAVHDQAVDLINQGKLQEAIALMRNQETDDLDQARVIMPDAQEIEQFFESLNHVNNIIRQGTFDGLRKLSPGGKAEVLKMFNQSFEGSSHNSVGDNIKDDYLKDHACYVITETAKKDLEQKIQSLGMSDKYKIIEGNNPQVFILKIHNRNIPFVCAQMMGESPEASNDNEEIDNQKMEKAA